MVKKAEIIQDLRQYHKLDYLLDVAYMSRSTFYFNLKKIGKSTSDKHEDKKKAIQDIFDDSRKTYGHRRITLEMRAKGYKITKKTVLKIMTDMGLKCLVRVKKYKSFKGDPSPAAKNIFERDFKADAPFLKWSTDITEFKVRDKKCYLSPIIDLYNGEIISYRIAYRPTYELVDGMIKDAIAKIPPGVKSVVIHSDQGIQYRTQAYKNILEANGITQSMSRKGNCLDNAVIENFFGILKTELFYLKKFRSIEHLIREIHDYIDFYNNRRIKAKLNGLSPVEFRTQSALAA